MRPLVGGEEVVVAFVQVAHQEPDGFDVCQCHRLQPVRRSPQEDMDGLQGYCSLPLIPPPPTWPVADFALVAPSRLPKRRDFDLQRHQEGLAESYAVARPQ